jgi:hypothetical protein
MLPEEVHFASSEAIWLLPWLDTLDNAGRDMNGRKTVHDHRCRIVRDDHQDILFDRP